MEFNKEEFSILCESIEDLRLVSKLLGINYNGYFTLYRGTYSLPTEVFKQSGCGSIMHGKSCFSESIKLRDILEKYLRNLYDIMQINR